jgi:hypothetical protein
LLACPTRSESHKSYDNDSRDIESDVENKDDDHHDVDEVFDDDDDDEEEEENDHNEEDEYTTSTPSSTSIINNLLLSPPSSTISSLTDLNGYGSKNFMNTVAGTIGSSCTLRVVPKLDSIGIVDVPTACCLLLSALDTVDSFIAFLLHYPSCIQVRLVSDVCKDFSNIESEGYCWYLVWTKMWMLSQNITVVKSTQEDKEIFFNAMRALKSCYTTEQLQTRETRTVTKHVVNEDNYVIPIELKKILPWKKDWKKLYTMRIKTTACLKHIGVVIRKIGETYPLIAACFIGNLQENITF